MSINPLTTLLPVRRVERLRADADDHRASLLPGELQTLLSAHEDARRLALALSVANAETLRLERQRDRLIAKMEPVLAISDRRHDAWDAAKAEIAAAKDGAI